MVSIEAFQKKYDVKTTEFSVSGKKYQFFVPRNIEGFINPEDLFQNFPLWAKIWEATAVLAHHLSVLPPDPDKTMLEIGAGMGVAGICAASFGHAITITEYNDNALDFARANASLNGIDTIDIRKLDWNAPALSGKFDYITGSEIIFKEQDIMGLFFLFQRYLKPGGTIILAENMRKTTLSFYEKMEKHYTIRMKKHAIVSDSGELPIILFEMKQKV